MKLKLINEKDEVCYYEVMSIVRAMEDAFKDVPLAMFRMAKEEEKASLDSLLDTIGSVNNRIVEFDQRLAEAQNHVVEKADEYWTVVSKAHTDLNAKIQRLPKFPTVDFNFYQFKELIEIAEKCDRLTDKQWARVIELARTIKERE